MATGIARVSVNNATCTHVIQPRAIFQDDVMQFPMVNFCVPILTSALFSCEGVNIGMSSHVVCRQARGILLRWIFLLMDERHCTQRQERMVISPDGIPSTKDYLLLLRSSQGEPSLQGIFRIVRWAVEEVQRGGTPSASFEDFVTFTTAIAAPYISDWKEWTSQRIKKELPAAFGPVVHINFCFNLKSVDLTTIDPSKYVADQSFAYEPEELQDYSSDISTCIIHKASQTNRLSAHVLVDDSPSALFSVLPVRPQSYMWTLTSQHLCLAAWGWLHSTVPAADVKRVQHALIGISRLFTDTDQNREIIDVVHQVCMPVTTTQIQVPEHLATSLRDTGVRCEIDAYAYGDVRHQTFLRYQHILMAPLAKLSTFERVPGDGATSGTIIHTKRTQLDSTERLCTAAMVWLPPTSGSSLWRLTLTRPSQSLHLV